MKAKEIAKALSPIVTTKVKSRYAGKCPTVRVFTANGEASQDVPWPVLCYDPKVAKAVMKLYTDK